MPAESPGSSEGPRVLILDLHEQRGRTAAEALEACGFPAHAASRMASAVDRTQRGPVPVLVIEDGAVSPAASSDAPPGTIRPEQARRLRTLCQATLVVAWSGSGPANEGPLPDWAEVRARGMEELVGWVAVHASMNRTKPVMEIERMQRAMEEVRAAAHDMSQPLTTILARAQLLMAGMPETDPIYRPISIISQEAERLARTVQRFQVLRQFRQPDS